MLIIKSIKIYTPITQQNHLCYNYHRHWYIRFQSYTGIRSVFQKWFSAAFGNFPLRYTKAYFDYKIFLLLYYVLGSFKKKNLTKRIFREAIFFYGITVLPHFPFLSVNDTIKYTDECMTPKQLLVIVYIYITLLQIQPTTLY